MTLGVRIIPCLDVHQGRVVKGVQFADLRDAGDPVELAERYFHEGADELTVLDISASTEDRGTTLDVVAKTAERVFIPLTVGGGISSVEDVDRLLRAGADKISVNTAAIARPHILNEISEKFGNQVLVLSVDAKRRPGSAHSFEVTTHGGRRSTGIDALAWISESIDRGVGEILLNSMDMDGTTQGFDIPMLKAVAEICNVPIIASGGAGRLSDFTSAAKSRANALLAASVFHFGHLTIHEVKRELSAHGIVVRDSRVSG